MKPAYRYRSMKFLENQSPKHRTKPVKSRAVRITGLLVLFILFGAWRLFLFMAPVTISNDEIDWSLTAVASSAPWAQGIAGAPRGDDAERRHQWPVKASAFTWTCAPGGSLLPPETPRTARAQLEKDRLRGLRSMNRSDAVYHSLRHGPAAIQLHLDGSSAASVCHDEHLDAGTCVDYGSAAGPSSRCLPILVIPGTQKAGTGTVRQYLLRHANLATGPGFSGAGKEINFFNSRRSTEEYLGIFRLARPERATEFFFDKSPNYLLSDTNAVFGKMARVAPSMALVIFLRNPTDRAYSSFKHSARHGMWVKVTSSPSSVLNGCAAGFELRHVTHPLALRPAAGAQAVLDATPEDFRCYLSSMRGDHFGESDALATLSGGLYASRLNEVLKHYPRRQVLVLWFEDAMRALLQTLRDIESFLGLPHADFAALSERSPVGHVRLKVAPSVRLLERLAAPLAAKAGVSPWLGTKLCASTGADCGGHSALPLDPATRAALDALFAAANADLLRLLHPANPTQPEAGWHALDQHSASHPEEEKAKPPPAPPSNWPFLCECARAAEGGGAGEALGSAGQEKARGMVRGEELCFGADALRRLTGIEVKRGQPPRRFIKPVRPLCKN